MVSEKVKSILAEQLHIDKESILPEHSIRNDLGADSLDIIDLLMAFEEAWDIDIPDDQVETTVGGVIDYLEQVTGQVSVPARKSA